MDRTGNEEQIALGTDVVGADGHKLGEVVAVRRGYVVVQKGTFFPEDYYIPTGAIESYEDGRAVLTLDRDEALQQGWDQEPEGGTYAVDEDFSAVSEDAGAFSSAGATQTAVAGAGTGASAAMDVDAAPFDHYQDSAQTHTNDADRIRVPVREEELWASTRPVELGEVRITKEVVTEEQVLEVPVIDERLRVQRRAVDRDASNDPDAFTEGTLEVTLMGETVDLATRVRVAEEIEIEKEAVERVEEVSGTVRREEVYVEDATAGAGPIVEGADYVSGERPDASESGGDQGAHKGLIERAREALRGDQS